MRSLLELLASANIFMKSSIDIEYGGKASQ